MRLAPAALLAAAAVALLALAEPKPDAVWGRLGHLEWLGFSVLAGLALTAAAVAAAPAALRRGAAAYAAAAWLGLGGAVALGELAAFAWPPGAPADNPFYLVTGRGVEPGVELPFERPAHLSWTGMSRGDLAVLNDDADPYARRVTFATDYEGFRNVGDIHRADLVFLGDSHTEAGNVPIEESFAQRVGERLGVTVRNLGRAGYSPSYELVVLHRYALANQPRALVWQVSEATDLGEELRFQRWLAGGRRPGVHRDAGDRGRLVAWRERSPTLRVFRALRRPRPWPHEARFALRDGEVVTLRFYPQSDREPPARRHPGWPSFVAALREGAAVLGDAGIDLVLLSIPTKRDVLAPLLAPEDWIRGAPAHARDERASLGRAMVGLAASLEVPLVDVTAALRDRARQGELVYQPYDTHLAAAGHAVVADALVEVLRER